METSSALGSGPITFKSCPQQKIERPDGECGRWKFPSSISRPDSGSVTPYCNGHPENVDESSKVSTRAENSPSEMRSNVPVFDEVLIDGFSILSFKSKKDLMAYSRQADLDQRKSVAVVMEDKNKRPRKSGSSKPKRPRLLYKCSVSDPPTTEEECQSRTGLNAGPDLSVIHPHNNHQNGCLANGLSRNATSTASPPSVTNIDSITGETLINHSVTGCDSLLGRHNMNSTITDYSPTPKLSPLKLSRVKRPDSDMTSRSDAKRHSHRRVKQQMTSGGEEPGRSAAGTDPCSTPASVSDSSETAFDPQPTSANHSSLPASTLSSVQTCHLTPQSTSLGLHPRRFSESNSNERSDDHWTRL